MLTVHGRTVESSKLFTGPVDWEIIRKIKKTVSIPVIANGGIGTCLSVRVCMYVFVFTCLYVRFNVRFSTSCHSSTSFEYSVCEKRNSAIFWGKFCTKKVAL